MPSPARWAWCACQTRSRGCRAPRTSPPWACCWPSIFVWHSWGSAAKVIVIGVLTILANPVGGHAIARAAYRIGIRPGKELVIDDLADPEACVEKPAEETASAQDAQELPAADRKEGEEQ